MSNRNVGGPAKIKVTRPIHAIKYVLKDREVLLDINFSDSLHGYRDICSIGKPVYRNHHGRI